MDSLLKAIAIGLVVLGMIVPLSFIPAASAHQMARFNSYAELVSFIHFQPSRCVDADTTPRLLGTSAPAGRTSTTNLPGLQSAGSSDYSTTNVQVQGVDELDTVKTDGQYIYTITNNTLVIVKAYPVSEARVLSRVAPNGTLTGVFVVGNRLILIGATPNYGPVPVIGLQAIAGTGPVLMRVSYLNPATFLWVYDISNRSSPVLSLTLQESGGYSGSRLIQGSIYLITTENLIVRNSSIELPSRTVNGKTETTLATRVYHSDVPDYYYSFTNVVRVDLAGSIGVASESFLISSSSTIYVSMGNIYLTSTVWSCNEETMIHLISIIDGAVRYEATGTVPGRVMNQFSMDENQAFFRVATSTWHQQPVMGVQTAGPSRPFPFQGLTTNIYVLSMDLRIVGRLEGLAPGEQFHSARFLGDRGYLVTFKKTDPLFVIDLRNPSAPKVLGELRVAGYSDYLQPYDETHLIGIGKNATDASIGTFAWYQGVKVSLFDVSDPTNPVETSNYVIGDRGTTSQALSDSHAVLFDHDRNLLVIPVEVAKLPQNNSSPWTWGSYVWQGAYVFSVSPQGGIVFKGGITHLQNGEIPSWNNSDRFVSRSLYIGNVLYTVSSAMLKMNSLTDLTELGTVAL